MRQAQRQPLVGVVLAAREHHLDHPVGAEDPADPHAGAAADEDAAPALGQLEDGRGFGDAHMGGGGEFQPAADHRAEHRRDHRQAAELDPVHHRVPAARMAHRVLGVALACARRGRGPEQKCPAVPVSTTAFTPSGGAVKKASSAASSASFIALRLAGRFIVSVATRHPRPQS